MSLGVLLIQLFDVFWLSAVLGLVAWQVFYGMRRTQQLEKTLIHATEQSAQAAHEAAHAVSLLARTFLPAIPNAPPMPPMGKMNNATDMTSITHIAAHTTTSTTSTTSTTLPLRESAAADAEMVRDEGYYGP